MNYTFAIHRTVFYFLGAIIFFSCSKSESDNSNKTEDKMLEKIKLNVLPVIPQKWMGLGYNQYPIPRKNDGSNDVEWKINDWNLTIQRIEQIKPSLVRMPVYRQWFDKDGSMKNYQWDSPEMKSFFRFMDYYQSKGIGIKTGFWNESHNFSSMPEYYKSSGANSFAQLQIDFLNYLIKEKKYTNIEWYTPTNEPKGSGISFDIWSTAIRNLFDALKENGLPTNILTGSDSWDDWTPLAAQHNSNELSSYEQHYYINQDISFLIEGKLEDEFKKIVSSIKQHDASNKPIFLGEIGFAASNGGVIDYWYKIAPIPELNPTSSSYGFYAIDYVIQMANSGISSGLAWSLDGFDMEKESGMWQNIDKNNNTRLRPWYYAWSTLSRIMPKGGEIYPLRASGNKIRGLAYCLDKGNNNYNWTFVIINYENEDVEVELNIPNYSGSEFIRYNYSKGTTGDGQLLRLPSFKENIESIHKGFTIKVPKQGTLLLSNVESEPVRKL
jgi:hypothetical protein